MSENLERYRRMFEEAQETVEYWAEGAIVEFTEALWARMEAEGVSRAELARRLGTSKAYVTKVLGGNANFTLYSLTKLALAVEGRIRVSIEPLPKRKQRRAPSAPPVRVPLPRSGATSKERGRRAPAARAATPDRPGRATLRDQEAE